MAKVKVELNQPSLFDFYEIYDKQGENDETRTSNRTRNANETKLGAGESPPLKEVGAS